MTEPAVKAPYVLGDPVHTAVVDLLPAGCEMTPMRLCRADCQVFYRLDRVEHERRTAAQAGWLDSFRPLEVLMNLPVGETVPRSSLSPALRTEIRRLPQGSAAVDRASVTRLAVRPLRVELIVTRATTFRRGLNEASQFAPFSRRAMLLERAPQNLDEALFEADFYGVGVMVSDGSGGVRMLLEPAQWRAIRHTTAGWCFAEEVYRKTYEARTAAGAAS